MIDKSFAQRWNQAGPDCTADMLIFIFRKIDSQADACNHNLVLDFILKRINEKQLPQFFWSVADLIERYSLEAMDDGKTRTKKEIKN